MSKTNETGNFARRRDDGNFDILNRDGAPVTRLVHTGPPVWPVGEGEILSGAYERPEGVILTPSDVDRLGIAIEE